MKRFEEVGWAGVLLVGVLSCGPEAGGGPLPWSSQARSAVVAVRPEGAEIVTYAALEGDDLLEADAVRLPRGGDAAILGFGPTLAELQLRPGPLSLPAFEPQEVCGELRVRRWDGAVLAGEGGPEGWAAANGVPDAFGGVGLPPLDPNACYQSGGCPDPELFACRLPCPTVPSPQPPLAPLPPELPVRCEGCEPGVGIDLSATCAPGERLALVEGACVPLGPPCPSRLFPEPAPGDPPTLYVDPEAPPGGDGGRETPFNDVEIALSGASPGMRVLLAPATYELDREVRNGWLEGVCPGPSQIRGQVIMAGSSTVARVEIDGEVVVVGGGFGTLRDVAIRRGEAGFALRLTETGRLDADALVVLGSSGIWVGPGSRLALRRSEVEGAPALEVVGRAEVEALVARGGGTEGRVLWVRDGGRLDLARAGIRAETIHAVDVDNGAELDAADLFVLGVPSARGMSAVGRGSRARLSRVVGRGFTGSTIYAAGLGGLEVQDLTVLVPDGSGLRPSHAIEVREDGMGDIKRVRVEGRFLYGASFAAAQPSSLRDTSFEGTVGALRVNDTDLHVDRIRSVAATDYGLRLTGRSSVTGCDLDILDVAEAGIDIGNASFNAPSLPDLERVRVVDAGTVGLRLRRLAGRIQDLTLRGGPIGVDLTPTGQNLTGDGLSLERARVEGHDIGLFLARFNPNLGDQLRLAGVVVQAGRTGLVLRSCWPDLGGFMKDLRIDATSVQALEFGFGE